jgi:hypothetical protein
MKRIVLILLYFLLGIVLFWAQNSEIKSNTETEPTSTQIMDNFISETNFIGTYALSKDERIFSELIGAFPLPKVIDQNTFISNCDSIIKIILKLYGNNSDAFSLNHLKLYDTEGSIMENREYSARFIQAYNGIHLIMMDNHYAQALSDYKEFSETDSFGEFSQFMRKKEQNKEYKKWGYPPNGYPIQGRIEIRYKPNDAIYLIHNQMFLKLAELPVLSVTKDDALTIAANKYKGPVYVQDLNLFAIPKNESRTAFVLRYIWKAGSSDGRYSGNDYMIDGTTGKILLESEWME